ncbi:MAG: hypothetical protein MUE88_03565 [Flavobacteriales bacterium]|jgi:hypothetical protein|nr:hypothetical protein [Flavobacteriales bacterium]
MRPRTLLLLVLLVLACTACRKEEDKDPPVVRILSPAEGFTLQVPDTLQLEVEVSDNERLEVVTAALTNSDGVPVGSSVTRALQGTSLRVSLALPVVDETYPGGPLTLTVRASDGTNDGRAFRQVNVLAAPLQRLAILLAPALGTTGTVYRFDPSTGAEPWYGPASIGPLLAIGPNVFLAGSDEGPLQRRSFTGGAWSTLAINGTPATSERPFFRGLSYAPFDDRIYVGMDDGRVAGYRPSGAQVFNGWSFPNTVSRALLPLTDRVVSAAYDEVGNTWQLTEHAYVSGDALTWRPMDHACVALRSGGGERVLSFGNAGGALVLRSIYMIQGGTIPEASVPGTTLYAVCTVGSDHFLATSSGIKRYRTTTGLSDLTTSGTVTSLAYDAATGSLWALEDGQLTQRSPSTGAAVGSWTVPAGMAQVEVVLNR